MKTQPIKDTLNAEWTNVARMVKAYWERVEELSGDSQLPK